MDTNANLRPNASKKHFDFDTFDSEITRELKENEQVMSGLAMTDVVEIEFLPDPPEATDVSR